MPEPDVIPMSPEEREAWYDANVAPKLMELGQACADRGIPFLAVAGYDGLPAGSSGRTCCFPAQRAPFFCAMEAAARCWEKGGLFNLDKFCIALARYAHGKPHSSIVLSLMGVPATPGAGGAR